MYLRDLSEKIASGVLTLEGVEQLDDEGVIAALTTVKGIGRWTAEMFLMFRLHRPDVLPVGRSRHRDRGAASLWDAQAPDAGTPSQAG